LVEFWAAMVAKVEEELTCQLYPMIPLGSLTADQEIATGERELAPAAGETGVGADGEPAAAKLAAASKKTRTIINLGSKRAFIDPR
jgi:hypothetical protein